MPARARPRIGARPRDALVVLVCAVGGAGAAYADHLDRDTSGLSFGIDLGVGLLACSVLWFRRRYPLGVALLLVPLDVLSFTGSLAYLVAVYTVANRRSARAAVVAAAAHVVAVVIGGILKSSPDSPTRVAVSASVVLGVAVVVGLYVAARRALVTSLHEQAERVLAERARDVEAARALERTRLAQEMHDVLAHRLSLITLHAGAMQVSEPGLGARTAESLDLVHANARAAMHELRDVIDILRHDVAASPGTPVPPPGAASRPGPQPTARDLPRLVAQSDDAGLPVEWRCALDDVQLATVPTSTGRHVYRLVQEALTNVHKHTDRASTIVSLSRGSGGEVCVEVRSALTPSTVPAPGNGTGLVGLHERITRAGGSFGSGVEGDQFVVRARIPAP